MARPRFHKLAVAKQELILSTALSEFSAHGFGEASLNRIIDGAGISKGSMYYYFDSKEDLYAEVIRDQLGRLLADAGPFPVPSTRAPDEYWAYLTDLYLRVMKALLNTPELAALLRGWVAGGAGPSLNAAQQQAEESMLPWLLRTLVMGQDIGAVRTDLPADLLLALVMALAQTIDVWLISQPPAAPDLDHTVRTLMGIVRRAVAPE